MNETITKTARRFSFPKIPAYTTTAMWMGSCLLGGFALGSKVHNPLKTTTLHFEKVSWLTNHEAVQLAKLDDSELRQNQLDVSVEFTPFELPSRKENQPQLSRKKHARKISPWAQLDRAIKNLKLASLAQVQKRKDLERENIFADYSSALRGLQRDFFFAMVPTTQSQDAGGAAYADTVVPAAAAAVRPVAPVTPRGRSSQVESTIDSAVAEVIEVKYGRKRKPTVPAPHAARAMDTQPVTIQKPAATANSTHAQRAANEPSAREAQPINVDAELQNLVRLESRPSRVAKAETAPSEAVPAARTAQVVQKQQPVGAYFSPELNSDQQKVLAEALLNEQSKTLQGLALTPAPSKSTAGVVVAANQATVAQPAPAAQVTAPAQQPQQRKAFGESEASTTDNETYPEAYDQNPEVTQEAAKSSSCSELTQTRFINTLGSQICPTAHTWLSKNWAGSGWVKVESPNSPTVLTYYPSPNTGSVLVLETNSLALLGFKTGARVMKGMGVIIGTVPAGFEVEFAGRAEEAEYFQVQGKNYFAIINAEPGAGVVQLTSKQNQQESATVFAPVLEDTLTYLDLAAPKAANFTVRVVKNGGDDSEIVGLTVGVSTSGKIQGITQSNGRAFLRNVPVVPGYPLYVDISSKMQQEQSYTYRYLLKNRNRAGEYVVYQVAEKSLFHWIKQVKQGLSDQSAMVVGFFDRKRLGGFKEHYFVKAEPQTTRFGLEPLNYSVLWDGNISATEPLEGDLPRFMSVQVPEGLTQVRVAKESGQPVVAELIPVSPRVIHVVSE